MIWIENFSNEGEDDYIPDELCYDGYQTDKNANGETPLMLWIKNSEEEIPEELYYNDCYADKNANGKTPIMLWKQYHHPDEDIPILLLPPEI